MSDTQKHPQPRVRGRSAQSPRPSEELRVLELEAEVAEIQINLDKAHAVSNDRLDWLEGTRNERDEAILQRDQISASLGEEIRLITQGRNEALHQRDTRYAQVEQVSTLLNVSPNLPRGGSIDDWGSDLRDAYESNMRLDAEIIYAPDVAMRDDYANQLAEAKTRLERLSAMTLFARLRWALAGGEV